MESPESIRPSPWLPSLMVLLFGVIFAWAAFLPLYSGDLGWHIRVGQYVLETGAIPRTNFLCWTAKWHPWLTHEWLSGVIFALLDKAGGFALLMLTRALLFTGTLIMLYRLGLRHRAEAMVLAGLTLLAACTLALHIALRPWGFSNLLLALFLSIGLQLRIQEKILPQLLFLTLLLALWINLHGGFIVGYALYTMILIELFLRPSTNASSTRSLTAFGFVSVWSALAALLLMLNPHGSEALILPLRYALGEQSTGLALTAEIKEWAPLTLNSFFGGVWICWVFLCASALMVSRAVRYRPETLLGAFFLLMSLHAQRHLPIAAILLYPCIAEGLLVPIQLRLDQAVSHRGKFWQRISQLESSPRPLALAATLSIASLFFLYSTFDPQFEQRLMSAKHYPLEIARTLNTQKPQRLLNHYDHAGLLSWIAPSWELFITPVNDAYPRTLFADWLSIAQLQPGWQALLDSYQVEAVLFPSDSALIMALKQDKDWLTTREDQFNTLMIRTSTEPTRDVKEH